MECKENEGYEDRIKQVLFSYYPGMKGMKISYGNSSGRKLVFTPSATRELLTFFSWGETTPSNCFELLAGLAGFTKGELTVVEHIIPGKLHDRSEKTAGFGCEDYAELLTEVELLNHGRKNCDKKFRLTEDFSYVGLAQSHPLELSPGLSVPDIALHRDMQQNHPGFLSVILNPQKKQLAAFENSVFTPIDMELLFDNTYVQI